nr:MAG TPA: hypothetical protein [Bacteriophage sp.]
MHKVFSPLNICIIFNIIKILVCCLCIGNFYF